METKNTVFHNCTEIVQYLEKNKEGLTNNSHYRNEVGGEFANYQDYDSLLKNLRLGNKEYNRDYLKVLNNLELGSDTSNTYNYTDDGMFYDMGEVINNAPECMLKDEEIPKKTLKLFIDVGYSGSTSNNVLKYRGIAIFKLLYTLYMQNYILDVSWVCFTEMDDANVYERIFFHLPQNELNIPTIATFCSPEFFRLMLVCMYFPFNYHDVGRSRMNSADIKLLKSQGLYIPGGYTSSEADSLHSQEKADKFIESLFNNYTKGGK